MLNSWLKAAKRESWFTEPWTAVWPETYIWCKIYIFWVKILSHKNAIKIVNSIKKYWPPWFFRRKIYNTKISRNVIKMLLKWTILEKRVTKNWLSVINAKVFYHYRANIAIKLLHFLHLFLHFSFFWVYIFFYIFRKIFYTFWQKVSGHPAFAFEKPK